MKRPMKQLSREAQAARRPLSPEKLVGALQDRVKTKGGLISSVPIRKPKKAKA